MNTISKNVFFAALTCVTVSGVAWAGSTTIDSGRELPINETRNSDAVNDTREVTRHTNEMAGTAVDDEAATTPATTTSLKSKSMSMEEMRKLTPKQVCSLLIDAATKDDFASANRWTLDLAVVGSSHSGSQQAGTVGSNAPTTTTADATPMREEFNRMSPEHLATLRGLSCMDSKVVGDHAFVESKRKDQSRLIPFIKDSNGVWKFDARTYMSFYRAMETPSS